MFGSHTQAHNRFPKSIMGNFVGDRSLSPSGSLRRSDGICRRAWYVNTGLTSFATGDFESAFDTLVEDILLGQVDLEVVTCSV